MKYLTTNATSLLLLSLFISMSASSQDTLSGDKKTACEVIICLSTGNRPDQCRPPIKKFLSIHKRKPSDTIKARGNFLKLCPDSDSNNEMSSLVDAMAKGGGSCDANELNKKLRFQNYRDDGDDRYYISNAMPAYCKIFAKHEYTRVDLPLYVGAPQRGGNWVERANYPQALAAYKKRIAREDCERQLSNDDNGYVSSQSIKRCVSRKLAKN